VATFSRSDNLRGAEFVEADLRGARFLRTDLSEVVMHGVELQRRYAVRDLDVIEAEHSE
jgi:uncharacterized protein YjbI with pentapeptide repeats